MLLLIFGSYLTLGLLRHLGDWSQRRGVQFFALMMPLVSLGLGIGGLHHFTGRTCLSRAPSWDGLLGIALPLGMALVTVGALGLGGVRLAVVARSGVPAGPELQALANDLAERPVVSRSCCPLTSPVRSRIVDSWSP